jgi:hypothetical protein
VLIILTAFIVWLAVFRLADGALLSAAQYKLKT